jgi:hypothetical protein
MATGHAPSRSDLGFSSLGCGELRCSQSHRMSSLAAQRFTRDDGEQAHGSSITNVSRKSRPTDLARAEGTAQRWSSTVSAVPERGRSYGIRRQRVLFLRSRSRRPIPKGGFRCLIRRLPKGRDTCIHFALNMLRDLVTRLPQFDQDH